MQKRKFSFTILEVMLALLLSSFLLFFLFYELRITLFTNAKVEKVSFFMEKRRYIQERLSIMVSHCTQDNLWKKTSLEPLSYSFMIQEDVDPEPIFCKPCDVDLILNPNQQLLLVTTPTCQESNNFSPRQEVLLNNVESLRWDFYIKQDEEYQIVSLPPKNKETLSMAILHIKSKDLGSDNEISFPFLFPQSTDYISYKAKTL